MAYKVCKPMYFVCKNVGFIVVSDYFFTFTSSNEKSDYLYLVVPVKCHDSSE
jgi:hypothetical protein